MSKHLHIVMHDVPWPVDFGGVTDLYFKIKRLHEQGIKIHLHCFLKSRAPQDELNKYCESVQYYPRRRKPGLRLPYIVSSRISEKLLANLSTDKHPILLEGIHCSYPIYAGLFPHRKVFLRLHNVEYKYYESLAAQEDNLLKKLYFRHEARLLKRYEKEIAPTSQIWAVSAADAALYENELGAKHVGFLPVFLPWDIANAKAGRGKYACYHGNLGIGENAQAAAFLIKNVFNDPGIPFIIAGKNPPKKLKVLTAKHAHISLIENPPEAQMQALIADAQVNVLPSLNSTGVKLKLLNALYNGRHCLVNHAAAAGSGVEELCVFAETAAELKSAAAALFSTDIAETELMRRNALLQELYNGEKNARRISAWIW